MGPIADERFGRVTGWIEKLDQLTRSLADFAKLVEPFDIIEGAQPPLRPASPRPRGVR